LGGQMVAFVGLDLLQDLEQRCIAFHRSCMKFYLILDVLYASQMVGWIINDAPDKSMDVIPFINNNSARRSSDL
jgi:hypothetical protein